MSSQSWYLKLTFPFEDLPSTHRQRGRHPLAQCPVLLPGPRFAMSFVVACSSAWRSRADATDDFVNGLRMFDGVRSESEHAVIARIGIR